MFVIIDLDEETGEQRWCPDQRIVAPSDPRPLHCLEHGDTVHTSRGFGASLCVMREGYLVGWIAKEDVPETW